jgi:hypothetical protein
MKPLLFGSRCKSSTATRNNSGTVTSAIAEARRWELRSWVIASIPELAELMQSARPPTIPELIALAQRRQSACPHCGKPLQPYTP